jgi:IS605 OrfB family transposase
MAKQIDVRKVVLPDCEFYESVDESIAVTLISRLKGITKAGHKLLLQRKPFCRLLRTLLQRLQAGELPDKSELCKRFQLPARMYNTAKVAAEGILRSAIECQKKDLEDTQYEINRQVVEAFWGESGQLPGRVRKLLRLYQKRSRLLAQQGHPRIHFGRKAYHDQEAQGWKAAYEEARSDRLGCLGSKDETAGNSTFQIKPAYPEGKLRFELYHAQELLGHFTLKPKEREQLQAIQTLNLQPFTFSKEECKFGKKKGQLVNRKISAGRVALTVWLIQEEKGHWYIHISWFKDKLQPDYVPVGAIGVDFNCDSVADTRIQIADGQPLIQEEHKRMFDPGWSREQKKAWIYEQVNQIVGAAKDQGCMVVLEYLDFEHSKRWLRTKLGAMLRVMPYRQIRKAFERRCMEQGVVLRYVKSNYTSILGAVLTDYPNLGRDQAAAAVIGLRAMEEGNAWLESQCKALAQQERTRLRINRKSKFGCTVTTDGVWIDRQLEGSPTGDGLALDRETDTHWFQNRAGRAISGLSKAMGSFSYKEKPIPTRWKGSGQVTGPWHPVVPVAKRSSEISSAQL